MNSKSKKSLASAFLLLLGSIVAMSQTIDYSGKLTNKQSQPIAFASVRLLNTNMATLTDNDGVFHFNRLSAGKYTIEISAIGYATINREIDTKNSTGTQAIQLQDAASQLDAVTVTAEKREQSLQQLPGAISSISATQVQQYRIWNTKEITGIVPNLNSSNSGDDRNVTSIRGITTTSYDPAVTTYVDGVNQFSLDTYIASLNDIERIEVLRGPQGTLYGRNAMGGVINIITKQPTNTTNGFVELNLGNYNQQRYSAGLRTPLVKDKLFFGASVLFNKRDGYYTNEFDNSSFDKQEGFNGNYYLKFLPSTKWAITLNVKHQNNKNDGAFPMVNGVTEAFDKPFVLNQNAIGQMSDNTLNASLALNYSGSHFTFSSQTAWQQNRRVYKSPIDGDFSPIDAVTISNDYGGDWNKVKVFTQEIRFASPANSSSPLKWTAGSYFFNQDNPTKQATNFGADAALIGVPDVNFSTISISKGKNTGIAFFGQANYSIHEKLELIAGLRYDYEKRELSVRGEYEKAGVGNIVTQADTSSSLNFSALSPKLGLNYHIDEDHHLFAIYSRGYRTGGLTQLSSDPSQPPLSPYDPEYSDNIEIGSKNSFFDNRLLLNINFFTTTVKDAQVPTLVLPDAITVIRNTGKLRSKGAEVSVSARPFKGFTADYNFGYTDAEYSSLKVSSNGQTVDLAGKKQIFTPEFTSMLALQYSYTISEKNKIALTVRGEWLYLGTQYFDLANTIEQSPYSLLNTRIGISWKNASLFFWGRNLGDKNYIAYAYDFGAIHLADPKTYGVTARFNF